MYNRANSKTPLNQSDDILQHMTFAEFFAGIGLMRMGLEKLGWTAAFANDIAHDKFDMYSAHFGEDDSLFLLEDIHNLEVKQIPTVTMATASFPCNDLSLAGMRKGLSGKQSSAFWRFVRILDEMERRRPPIVLLENVAGFLTSHGGRDFQAALLALNRLGYTTDAIIIDASRFVPQSRVRLFVIGVLRNGHANWEIRETLRFYESAVRPKALADFIFTHPEIVWNLRDLSPLPSRRISLSDIIEDLPDDSAFWWNKKRRDYLVSQMSEKHATQLQQMMDAQCCTYGTVFRRIRKGRSMAELRTDGIAGCLRTPRGGSGRQILLQAGYGQVKVRLLTPRECARLMGADDFIIDAPLNKALFGFGDAVCVPVINWIAKNYLNPLVEEMQALAKKSHSRGETQKNSALYAIEDKRESVQ
jgi:DNA (cytosine-5)-methyltransferase 1